MRYDIDIRLSPSIIGEYFDTQCDRKLIYTAIGRDGRKKMDWNELERSDESAAEAGNNWEKRVVSIIENRNNETLLDLKNLNISDESLVKFFKGEQEINGKKLKHFLKDKDCIYLYQMRLQTTNSFNNTYLSKYNYNFKVCFGSMYPDLIRIVWDATSNKFLINIIDVKGASKLKVGAQIQVALYTEIIKNYFKDNKIENYIIDDSIGYIWNKESITNNILEHPFSMFDAKKDLEDFFEKKLQEVCNIVDNSPTGLKLRERLDYLISQKCEYCGLMKTCVDACYDKASVRIMPYISENAQEIIKKLVNDGVIEDDSIDSVSELLESDDKEKLKRDCSFWKNVSINKNEYFKGLKECISGGNNKFKKNGTTYAFPAGHNFGLVLTAQRDDNSGRVYAYSWYLKASKNIDIFNVGINKKGYADICIGENNTRGDGTYFGTLIAENDTNIEFDRISKEFVLKIYDILSKISGYDNTINITKERETKQKLQFYVMDQYEKINIESELYYLLDTLDPIADQDLFSKLISIIFYIQGEHMVTDSDDMPKECYETPVAVITSAVSKMYVLPLPIAYNLKGIARIFSPEFHFGKYDENYFELLSNVLNGNAIKNIWDIRKKNDKEKNIANLKKHLLKRLNVEHAIIKELRDDNEDKLTLWPPKYKLQELRLPGNTEVAKLYFETLYEEILKYKMIRNVRSNGIENAIEEGNILRVEYVDSEFGQYQILNKEYKGREWFSAFICEDTEENREEILKYCDWSEKRKLKISEKYMNVFCCKKIDGDYDFVDDGNNAYLNFDAEQKYKYVEDGKTKYGSRTFTPELKKKYLIFEIYRDFNSKKTLEGLNRLVGRIELIKPEKMDSNIAINYSDNLFEAYWSPDRFYFSDNQKRAFEHIVKRRLSVITGAPAAGKTNFIARTIITISRYYNVAENRKLKILVSAMSHSAIENVLAGVEKMLSLDNSIGQDINLYKAKDLKGNSCNIKVVEEKKIHDLFNKDEIVVLGATNWSLYKAYKNMKPDAFDLIIIDEASQVRSMDAFLTLECSNENSRIVLVGDDNQLPPIILGKYKSDSQKYLYGSIFRLYLTALGNINQDIININDNFRMNDILCRYSAKEIYGPDYRASNDNIRRQLITLKQNTGDELLDYILDEKYPLIYCRLADNENCQNEVEVEVELVTLLVSKLKSLLIKDGSICNNEKFWGDSINDGACGIITPHHEHINRLKTRISNELDCNRNDLYIGTVDKLQGQERDVVIVSYGVNSKEKVINESEFIFSRNRFNVSLTRGKAKTIVILSSIVALSNITTNAMKSSNDELDKGMSFIHGFDEYMSGNSLNDEFLSSNEIEVSEKKEFQLNGVSIIVMRKKLEYH